MNHKFVGLLNQMSFSASINRGAICDDDFLNRLLFRTDNLPQENRVQLHLSSKRKSEAQRGKKFGGFVTCPSYSAQLKFCPRGALLGSLKWSRNEFEQFKSVYFFGPEVEIRGFADWR